MHSTLDLYLRPVEENKRECKKMGGKEIDYKKYRLDNSIF